ncbi:MAG: hypothetical protein V3S49_04860 [Thermodesulfobacteriota bacterium]
MFEQYRERKALGLSEIRRNGDKFELVHKRWIIFTGENDVDMVIPFDSEMLEARSARLTDELSRLTQVISEVNTLAIAEYVQRQGL